MSLESAKEKLAKRFEGDIDERLKEIYVAPYGGPRSQVSESERFFLLNQIEKIFTESDLRSLLILGDSGAGKTNLCLHACKRLWEAYRKEETASPSSSGTIYSDVLSSVPDPSTLPALKLLPIYIHLAQYKKQLREGLLEQVLKDTGLTSKEIRNLKITQPLLLLLDGFDEVNIEENLYQTQRWGQPGYQIRILITCRPEALVHKNKQALFEVSQGYGKGSDYKTLHIQSFTEEQIKVYLERYVEQNPDDVFSSSQAIVFPGPASSSESVGSSLFEVQDYLNWFERLPSLKELIKTPFLLMVAVRALPRIVTSFETSGSESSSFPQQRHLTQSGLFKAFLKDWFFRQAKRVKAQGLLAMLSEKEIQGYMEAYAKNLAASLIGFEGQLNERALSEEECLCPELIEPYQNEGLLEKYRHSDPAQNQAKYFFDELSHGIKTQTELQKSHLRAILSGCMLRSVRNQFRFIHKSIAEYLAAQELMDGLLGNYDHYVETLSGAQNLNHVLLTKEPQILARLAEASLEEERFKELLEQIILATKTQNGLSVAAANAISILNRAGTSFCNRDFSQIQIPRADLSESLCAGTHFEGADLRGVNFQRAYLAHAHFEGANLEEVEFGEQAYWEMPSSVNALVHYAPSPGVSEWLVGCQNGYAYRLNDRGQLLKSYRHKPYQLLLFGANAVSVNAIAVHPDSTPRLATGGSNHLIWVWAFEGTAFYRLEGHTGLVTTLAFRPDGRLASGSEDNTIRLWETDGAPGPVLRGHTRGVTSLALRPNGGLASGSWDTTIRLWEADGTPGPVLSRHTGPITSLALGPDGHLASGSRNTTICLWEPDGTPGPVLCGHTGGISVALRPNGGLLSGSDATVRLCLWEPDGAPKLVPPEPREDRGWVKSLVLRPDGGLASGNDDTIRLWEPDGTPGPVLHGHTRTINSLAFRPDGRLVSGSMDKTIRLWEADGAPGPMLRGHTRTVVDLALYPDGRLVSGSKDTTIRLWEPDGTPGPVLHGHTDWVTSLTVLSDGRLASGSKDTTIRLWEADATPSSVLYRIGSVKCFALCSDGRFALGSWDNTIWLWEPNGTPVPVLCEHMDEVVGLTFLSDGRLASRSLNREIHLWEPDGTPGPVLRGNRGQVDTLILLPDGGFASGYNAAIHLWELDGTPGPVLRGHTRAVLSLALCPDGRLASGSDDNDIRLWSFTEARLLQTVALDFSISALLSGQEFLYAGGGNGEVLAFTIDTAHQFHIQWVRTGAPKLTLTGLQLQGALNLSEDNHALLKQRGAEGTPHRAPRPYLSWCHLFQSITGTAHVEPQRPLVNTTGAGTSPHLISNTAWVVSIARKKEEGFSLGTFFGTSGSDHAFLILEGIRDRRRFIIRAELTYDVQTKQVHITMNPLGDLARFAAFVARGIEAHQFPINVSVGESLLHHIQADQQKVIRYSLLGDGGKRYPSLLPSASPSPSSSGSPASATPTSTLPPSAPVPVATVTETHNCLSWCRKQVMQIGQEMPTRWYNFAVTIPSDVTAPQRNPASSSVSSITPTPRR